MSEKNNSDDWATICKTLEMWTSEMLNNPEHSRTVKEIPNRYKFYKKEDDITESLIHAIKEKNWQESCKILESNRSLLVDDDSLINFLINFFISKMYEQDGNIEKYQEFTRKAYIFFNDLFTNALFPIGGDEDIKKILGEEYGEFPLYGFFLFSSFDQNLITFINEHAAWLHNSSGNDVLLSLFENPEKWGQRWKEYWQKKLGSEFDEKNREWSAILPEDRDLGYNLADQFGIEKNLLPCIVFVNSYKDKQILCVPIIENKENYRFYFEDLFTVVQNVKQIPAEHRFPAFQKKWKKLWIKWILPEKIKGFSEAVKEWGSLIIDTKNTIIAIIEPVTPFLTSIKNTLSK